MRYIILHILAAAVTIPADQRWGSHPSLANALAQARGLVERVSNI